MRCVEIWYRGGSFTRIARERGHEVLTISDKPEYGGDITFDFADLASLDANKIPDWAFKPDLIWASPPCNVFCNLARRHYWAGGQKAYLPANEKAKKGIENAQLTLSLIDWLGARYWFVENPLAMLRKMDFMQPTEYMIRQTINQCAYGRRHQKPTDIWTNCRAWIPRPRCKRGAPCHEAAPRGTLHGVQGMDQGVGRAHLPDELSLEIIKIIEGCL